MKRLAALFTALVIGVTMTALTGCKKDKNETSSSESEASVVYKDPESGAKPVLSINNTEGRPGETVEVTVSLEGCEGKWAMCGVHFSYPMVLECRRVSEDERFADYKPGEAVSNMSGFTSALWFDNRTEAMVQNEQYSLFFCSAASGNTGRDGEIATFYFTIPEDAAVGTVYPLEFFEHEGDMFLDVESDANLQHYAFTNWKNGSITVV